MAKLLITDYPLVILPTLAKSIGVESALVLQQIQYWVDRCGRSIEDKEGKWIYNSLDDWHKQFSFWSLSKLRRIIKTLEDKDLIISQKINSKKWNQTKWYTINFKIFNKLIKPQNKIRKKLENISTNRFVQNEQMLLKETENNYTNKSSYIEEHINIKKINKKSFPKKEILISSELRNTAETMVQVWNEVFDYSLKPIQAFLNNKTIFQLNKILQTKFDNDLESWRFFAKKVNSSKFLMGEKETKTNFKAEFLWLIKVETIDSIQNGAYGLGDRVLDLEKIDENLKLCKKELQQVFQEKISKKIEEESSLEIEEEFKKYLLTLEFEKDGDKYLIKKHMDMIGSKYMYGGYITPSHIFYNGNEKYKKRIFNSYLMKKYYGIDETEISASLDNVSSKVNTRTILLNFKKIKERLRLESFTSKNKSNSLIGMVYKKWI